MLIYFQALFLSSAITIQDFREPFCGQTLKVTPFNTLMPLTVRVFCHFSHLEVFNFCFKWQMSLPNSPFHTFSSHVSQHILFLIAKNCSSPKFLRLFCSLQPPMRLFVCTPRSSCTQFCIQEQAESWHHSWCSLCGFWSRIDGTVWVLSWQVGLILHPRAPGPPPAPYLPSPREGQNALLLVLNFRICCLVTYVTKEKQ